MSFNLGVKYEEARSGLHSTYLSQIPVFYPDRAWGGLSETRREPIPGGSSTASMLSTVSENPSQARSSYRAASLSRFGQVPFEPGLATNNRDRHRESLDQVIETHNTFYSVTSNTFVLFFQPARIDHPRWRLYKCLNKPKPQFFRC